MNIDRDTPMWQLTLGDFLQAFQKYTEIPNNPEQEVIEKKEYVYVKLIRFAETNTTL